MTPAEQAATALIIDLCSRGFSLWAEEGKVMVKPAKELTPEDVAAIKANRDAMLPLLCPLTEGQIDALAVRAYEDPPDFGEGNVVERETVLVDVFGEWWAFSPEAIREIDGMARLTKERKAKEDRRQEKQKARERKKSK